MIRSWPRAAATEPKASSNAPFKPAEIILGGFIPLVARKANAREDDPRKKKEDRRTKEACSQPASEGEDDRFFKNDNAEEVGERVSEEKKKRIPMRGTLWELYMIYIIDTLGMQGTRAREDQKSSTMNGGVSRTHHRWPEMEPCLPVFLGK